MAGTIKGKRPAPSSQGSSKKRKLNNGKQQKNSKNSKNSKGDAKGKDKAADRGIIPIPNMNDDDIDLSDQDMDMLGDFGEAASFLNKLDRNGLMRSKKETIRLHELTKPVRTQEVHDDLPSLNSDDDDEDVWSSGISADEEDGTDDEGSLPIESAAGSDDSDAEMPYETASRKKPSWVSKTAAVQRLPIKLADGRIKETGIKIGQPTVAQSEDEETDSEPEEEPERQPREDIATGARFGRAAVVDVLQTKSRRHKVEMAKDQIAGICQEILADPENSLGLLRRLHTFSLQTITTPLHPEPVDNDPIIRKLAILSQLAIFKDVIPGYRIRSLTDTEKSEKVSQMVARTREWEQGLVSVYQAYLRLLELELKTRTELAEVALQSMCTLLIELTHFNFRTNIMACIVTRLSKKSWDKSSDLCHETLCAVFRADLTGLASLEIVRLLNRMIKERHFRVHPKVLACLLRLRLRTELGVRASDTHADRPESGKKKYGKAKKAEPTHLSKKAKKALKEQKEIDKEMREAEAEVDKEERRTTQTETLKLLFALYFRILKNPAPSPLLPAALNGISKFSHMVNIDFFKDLLKVLKDLISMEEDAPEDVDPQSPESLDIFQGALRRLMCIVTAFELLSGQGEALNIDLSEFISSLFAMLLPLSLVFEIDAQSATVVGPEKSTVVDMLFRALNMIFSPRTSGASALPWRSAAFAKRLLTVSLHWPSAAVLRTLDFVGGLLAKDSKLEAMLSTEDRIFNGVYRADIDDPELSHPFESSFWELHALHQNHWDPRVRKEAGNLLNYKPS
ncbi:nucleolar complex-associated protein-domain-containing protein [Crassisporium funariophilum]|nr:nucleolar complex-associated protein-domain-containing protein [Crassisporium funariophilum]